MHYGPAVITGESHHHRSEDRYPSLVAAFIVMVTGMRSSALNPIPSATCIPIRQLWHPLSAIAGSSATLTCFLSAKPKALLSSSNTPTQTRSIYHRAQFEGCRLFVTCLGQPAGVRLAKASTLYVVHVAFTTSLAIYAGHLHLLKLHGGFLPWPFSAQNQHNAVESNVCSGFGSGLGLVVVAPLVHTSCCLLRRYILLAAFTLGISSRHDVDRLPDSRTSTNLIISSSFIFWFWSLVKSN